MVITKGITDVTAEVNLGLNLSEIWQQKARGHSRQKEQLAQRHGVKGLVKIRLKRWVGAGW